MMHSNKHYTHFSFSYVPSEDEPTVIYEKPGVSVDVSKLYYINSNFNILNFV
jgi:hypothetical protein